MTAGAFVGIAFQPMFWYFVALGVSLREYVRRVEETGAPVPLPGWRGAAQRLTGAPVAARGNTRL